MENKDKENRWTFVRKTKSKKGRMYGIFACSCGTVKEVAISSVKNNLSRSCGCIGVEIKRTHGMTKTSEYRIYDLMKRRCSDKKKDGYHRYGGRGIKVCSRWLESFQNFYADMGPRPSKKHSLDRINNDGDYEPSNVKWSTLTEQNNNKSTNVYIEEYGVKQSVADWTRTLEIPRHRIYNRLRQGWSHHDALFLPRDTVTKKGKNRSNRKDRQADR